MEKVRENARRPAVLDVLRLHAGAGGATLIGLFSV
jgi:hypothetical protein